jgi:hypothetical protein
MWKRFEKSRLRIQGRFNEAYNVERRDIHLSPEVESLEFIQVSRALSVGKRNEKILPC